MPIIKAPIEDDGALVRVSIGWSATRVRKLRLAKRRVPGRMEAMALLDPCAEATCLDAKLIADLELPFDGVTLANAPALEVVGFASQYDASLTILHPSGRLDDYLIITDWSIMELQLNTIGYQAIIGRDLLARCLFLYNGPRSRFAIKY